MVFAHNLYEYKKGLRDLVLHTTKKSEREYIEHKLNSEGIDYIICENSNNINVFFGNKYCIEVLKTFSTLDLSKISPEEDFILGIMLGYSRIKECGRYLKMKKKRIDDLQSNFGIDRGWLWNKGKSRFG